MKSMNRFVVGCVMAAVLAGCPLLKKKGDDASEDETPIDKAPTVTVSGTGAKNEKDVLRYAKEQKLGNETATIAKDGTKARTFPGSGQEVATLSKGTTVTKIAKYFSTGVLVTFADPADNATAMGWISPEALETPPGTTPPPTGTPATPPKPVAIVDAGSKGAPVDAGAVIDAGADAGAKAKDAGAPVADAGASALPQPGKATLLTPPVDNKCPTGFALINAMCRRTCNAEADCPRTTFCVPLGGKKVCSTSK